MLQLFYFLLLPFLHTIHASENVKISFPSIHTLALDTLTWVYVSHRLGYIHHKKGMMTIPSQRGVMNSAKKKQKKNTQTSQHQHFWLSFNCWLQLPASSRTHTKSELNRHCLPKLQAGHYFNMNVSKYGKNSLGYIEISS